MSAWKFIIDADILKHIIKCTKTEAHRQLKDDKWSVSMVELEAFIGIWYVRGAMVAKGIGLKSLWSKKWGFPLCKNPMLWEHFIDIMKYLRFYKKSIRTERLNQTGSLSYLRSGINLSWIHKLAWGIYQSGCTVISE